MCLQYTNMKSLQSFEINNAIVVAGILWGEQCTSWNKVQSDRGEIVSYFNKTIRLVCMDGGKKYNNKLYKMCNLKIPSSMSVARSGCAMAAELLTAILDKARYIIRCAVVGSRSGSLLWIQREFMPDPYGVKAEGGSNHRNGVVFSMGYRLQQVGSMAALQAFQQCLCNYSHCQKRAKVLHCRFKKLHGNNNMHYFHYH